MARYNFSMYIHKEGNHGIKHFSINMKIQILNHIILTMHTTSRMQKKKFINLAINFHYFKNGT